MNKVTVLLTLVLSAGMVTGLDGMDRTTAAAPAVPGAPIVHDAVHPGVPIDTKEGTPSGLTVTTAMRVLAHGHAALSLRAARFLRANNVTPGEQALIAQITRLPIKNSKTMELLFVEAVRSGYITAIKTMLAYLPPAEQGAFIIKTNNYGDTALHYAASNGRIEIARLLIENLSSVEREAFIIKPNFNGNTALHKASNKAIARLLIENLPSAKRVAFITNLDFNGNTALHYYAKRIKKALLLLEYLSPEERVVFINQQNKKGDTALHDAVRNIVQPLAIFLLTLPEFDFTLRNQDDKAARDCNPEFFDECAEEANRQITEHNQQMIASMRPTIIAFTGLPSVLAYILADYLSQPLIPLPDQAAIASTPATAAAASAASMDHIE